MSVYIEAATVSLDKKSSSARMSHANHRLDSLLTTVSRQQQSSVQEPQPQQRPAPPVINHRHSNAPIPVQNYGSRTGTKREILSQLPNITPTRPLEHQAKEHRRKSLVDATNAIPQARFSRRPRSHTGDATKVTAKTRSRGSTGVNKQRSDLDDVQEDDDDDEKSMNATITRSELGTIGSAGDTIRSELGGTMDTFYRATVEPELRSHGKPKENQETLDLLQKIHRSTHALAIGPTALSQQVRFHSTSFAKGIHLSFRRVVSNYRTIYDFSKQSDRSSISVDTAGYRRAVGINSSASSIVIAIDSTLSNPPICSRPSLTYTRTRSHARCSPISVS